MYISCYRNVRKHSSLGDTKKANHGNRSNIAATVLETHDNLHVPILLSL